MAAILRQLRGDLLVMLVFSSVFGLSALAQTAPNVTQVPAGTTAALPQPTPGAPVAPESKNILKEALSPQTRQTLQEAVNATPAPQ